VINKRIEIQYHFDEKKMIVRRSLKIVTVFTAMFIFIPIVMADTIPEFNSIVQISPDGQYLNVEKRSDFANSLSVYCKTTQLALPSNTPQEDKWLNNELRTTDATKIGRVLVSKEYSRFKIQATYGACLNISEQILQAQKDFDIRLEAILYLNLLEEFSGEDIEFYAQKADVDSNKYGMGLFRLVRSSINRMAASAIRYIH
jgi:hypothetical protein